MEIFDLPFGNQTLYRKWTLTIACLFLTSCVILPIDKYEGQKKLQSNKDLKYEAHEILMNKTDKCGISPILKIISKNITRISKTEFDEIRVNRVKDELVKVYYRYSNGEYDTIRDSKDLENKVSCYLDYMLNPKYEYVSFFNFFNDSQYRSFPCS